MRAFKKESIGNHIRVNGQIVPWEPVGNGRTGVRTFDEQNDAPIIAELDRLADQRKMGVVRISSEIYDGLKKNRATSKPPQSPFGVSAPIRVVDRESTLVKPKPKPVPVRQAAEPAAAGNRSGMIQPVGRQVVIPARPPAAVQSVSAPAAQVQAEQAAGDQPPEGAVTKADEVRRNYTPRTAKKSEVEAKAAKE